MNAGGGDCCWNAWGNIMDAPNVQSVVQGMIADMKTTINACKTSEHVKKAKKNAKLTDWDQNRSTQTIAKHQHRRS